MAVNYVGQSGRAWARRAETPFGARINAEVRDGSRRVDNWNLLDLRLQKMFNLGSSARIGLFFDLLNTFNEGTSEGVLSRFGTSSSYKVPSDFMPPRRLQLGVKFMF